MRDNVVWTIGWTIGAVTLIVSIVAISIIISLAGIEASTATWTACIDAGRQMVNGVCL